MLITKFSGGESLSTVAAGKPPVHPLVSTHSSQLGESCIAGSASVYSHGVLLLSSVELRMSNECVSAVFMSWARYNHVTKQRWTRRTKLLANHPSCNI